MVPVDMGRVPEMLGDVQGTERGEMMTPTLAALLLATVPLELPVTDHVDVCEIQSYYDGDGREVFTQSILRDFNPATCTFEVRTWWLVKCDHDVPVRGEILRFDGGTMRRVKVGFTFRSHGQFDAELSERQQVPVEERRNLSPAWKQVRRVLESDN